MSRPTLSDDEQRLRDAHAAVDAFVAELQAGVDGGDAQIYNNHFADDVLWGSPFGATVGGYDSLHAIHRRLFAAAVAGPRSRYEKVAVGAPAPNVAVAQVRRTALTADGTPVPIEQDSRSPKWRSTCWCAGKDSGGWRPGRTRSSGRRPRTGTLS